MPTDIQPASLIGRPARLVATGRPNTHFQAAYRAFRRVADVVAALLLLTILLPLMALIAAAIKLDSPGPVFFRQARAGLNGRPFTILKFRTMCVNAPKYSEKVADDDARVTPIGRLLRRTGLDELPQLINVLAGEMALIGPRPEQITLIDRYEPWQLRRHDVRPGITGWWQVHHRGQVRIYDNVEKDLEYIDRQGPLIDMLVLFLTVRVCIVGVTGRRHSPGRTSAFRSTEALRAQPPSSD